MELNGSAIAKLRDLEESLWRSETRFDPAHMESVLAPDFFEFGRSGRIWAREDALGVDPKAIEATLPFEKWSVRVIDETTVQVTYVSQVKYDEVQRANRSSIWSKTDVGWRLRFHQGTPVD